MGGAEFNAARASAAAGSIRSLTQPRYPCEHVVFHGNGVVLGGDLLFAGSIGRTDLPLADPRAMEESLARICELDDDLVVYPGHGPATTIGRERATNPYLVDAARSGRR